MIGLSLGEAAAAWRASRLSSSSILMQLVIIGVGHKTPIAREVLLEKLKNLTRQAHSLSPSFPSFSSG